MCMYLMMTYGFILLKSVILIDVMSNMLYDDLRIEMNMCVNRLNIGMMWLISLICGVIVIYVRYYLDKKNNAISVYLNLFSLFMMLFCISSLLIYNLIGYEFIGIISYILINFYVFKLQSNKCSLYSLLIGKVGDLGILIGLFVIYSKSMFYSVFLINSELLVVVSVLIGIISKSAQYLLLSWLILAMLGRTRVSALLLSSTLVTSGLYWIIILRMTEDRKSAVILSLSLITVLMIGMSSYLAYDLKRIIAFSTSAQMSFILIIISVSLSNIGVLLVITLGLNKALLFLSVGVLILSYKNVQDLRYVKTYNRFALILSLITTLNMIGFYCTIVYFSKELIIDYLHLLLLVFIKYLILIASLLTITYSIKLFLCLM